MCKFCKRGLKPGQPGNRVKQLEDALRQLNDAAIEALPYVERADDCAFPYPQETESVLKNLKDAIALVAATE